MAGYDMFYSLLRIGSDIFSTASHAFGCGREEWAQLGRGGEVDEWTLEGGVCVFVPSLFISEGRGRWSRQLVCLGVFPRTGVRSTLPSSCIGASSVQIPCSAMDVVVLQIYPACDAFRIGFTSSLSSLIKAKTKDKMVSSRLRII